MPRTVAITIVVLVLLPRAAEPCTCTAAGPPCAAYWTAAVIFRGRVESVEHSSGVRHDPFAPRTVNFTVLEAFKGAADSASIQLTTPGSAAACGSKFIVGREYIVYAARSADGMLSTSTCSRTAPVERASADLAYARSIASGGVPLGRIGGRVVLRFRDLTRRRDREQPMCDVAVTIANGAAAIETRTDRSGAFSVDGLGPGVYGVTLALPLDMAAALPAVPIELADARGCGEVKLAVHPNGRVAGRVLDAARRPVAGLTIDLTPPAGLISSTAAQAAERLRTTTASDGRYEFSGVPPGTFVVGVNTRQEPDAVPRILHPGVADRDGAASVVVAAGGRIDLGDLVLPSRVPIAQVTGFVFDSHGSPVEGARVYLRGADDRGVIIGEPVATDFMGRFVISASRDTPYQIFAERPRPGDTRGRVDASEPAMFTASASGLPVTLRLKRQ